ncbi:hypothetical protein [Streptomyces yangpuensis]|uniref:hypothetical protein n=1 Tax=Streptomyces yangpuensis TaxID=1648182 RepID=UPI0036A574BD
MERGWPWSTRWARSCVPPISPPSARSTRTAKAARSRPRRTGPGGGGTWTAGAAGSPNPGWNGPGHSTGPGSPGSAGRACSATRTPPAHRWWRPASWGRRSSTTDWPWSGGAAALAAELLDRAPQPFHPGSTDPYDLDRLDEDDEEDLCHGAVHVVASVFLEAEALAEYPFLQDWTDARFAEIHDTVAEHLRAAYGPPLPADRAAFLRFGDGERSVTWQVGERLLVLQEWMVIGDGDVEMEIWLAAVDA